MSRRAKDPVQVAAEATTKLSASELALLDAYLAGWRQGKGLPPQPSPAPRKRERLKKSQEAAEL